MATARARRGGRLCESVGLRARRGAGAGPSRRGWAHLWGFAEANPDPGKVKGRRAAGGVRAREGLGVPGAPPLHTPPTPSPLR